MANSHFLSLEEEKSRYELHNNSIDNQGYVNFLKQAIKPAIKYLAPKSYGLDYGCGPAPTLNLLIKEKGFDCRNYDPLFFPEFPYMSFDFIFATECFEHFFYPLKELKQINTILKNQGHLVVMTSFWNERTDFRQWHYTNDPTHVIFFHKKTFDFIAAEFRYQIVYFDNERVIILRKTD